MWHWLPSALFKDISWQLSKRQKFLLQLCGLVLVGHLGVVFLCTLLYQADHDHERFNVSLSKSSAVLVLSPLQKRVQHKQVVNTTQKKDELQVTKVIDMQTYEQQKKLPKKQEAQAKLTVEAKDIAPEKSKQKAVEKKVSTPSKKAKPGLQAAHVKETVQNKKNEQKVEKSREKKEVQKKEQTIEQKTQEIDVENATFVGYEELDSLTIQSKIQQQVQKYFKLPVGISEKVSCELQVQINKQGKAQQVSVCKSSGIMVYDVSARASVYHYEFPRDVWNKTITIVIGQ